MNGTWEVIRQGRSPQSPSTRPAFTLSPGPKLRGFRGGVCRTRPFPGNGSLTISPPARAPQSHPDWPFLPVAYRFPAISRLGFSPNWDLDSAYHTTFYKSQGSTNKSFSKKTRGFPALFPAAPSIGPVAQWPQRIPRSWKQGQIDAQEFFPLKAFIISRTQKRTNYMSNLIFPLPPLASIPPRSPSVPGGVLTAHTSVASVPALSEPSTLPVVSLPKKPAFAAPSPGQSARCSVKGCVFPAPFQGHPKCHYHELLQSEGELFQSHQPTHLLSLQAPFGIPDYEPDDSRQRDRKRQAAEREAFLFDGTA